MICPPCKEAAHWVRRVLNDGPNAPMGSLHSAQRMHGKCTAPLTCPCQHKLPFEATSPTTE